MTQTRGNPQSETWRRGGRTSSGGIRGEKMKKVRPKSASHFIKLTFIPSVATEPQGIFGIPLSMSIRYANVAISLCDNEGKTYIYGYVPIIVAKCGVFLKEMGKSIESSVQLCRLLI